MKKFFIWIFIGGGFFCSIGEAELTVTVNSTETAATVIVESDTLSLSQTYSLIAFQCDCPDGYGQAVHNEVGKLRLELTGLLPGSVIDIQSLNISDEDGTADANLATQTEDFCTKPLPPDFSAIIAARNFGFWESDIHIYGQTTPVESSGGNLDYYHFDPGNPHGSVSNSNPSPVLLDSQMAIEGLSVSTQYNFIFYGMIEGCSRTQSIDTTTLTLCTVPGRLTVSAMSSSSTSITIEAASVHLSVDTGFVDSFFVDIISPTDQAAVMSQSKSVGTEDVEITGLLPGTQYQLQTRHVFGNNVQCSNGPLETAGDPFVACTAPEPVSSAVVSSAANSVTSTEVVLTVTAATNNGVNPDSVIAVTPYCGGAAETVQYPTCNGNDDQECELTGLTPGCEYSFAVTRRLVCGGDQPYITYSTAVNVTACTIPSTAAVAQTAYTVDPTSIQITSVAADTGVFQDFGIKSVNANNLVALTKTASGLTPGTCYDLGIVLTRGTLEGAVSSHKLCSLFEQSIGSETTASVTLSWPLDAASLTDHVLAVTTYEVVVDGDAANPQTGTASQDLVVDSLTPPGSKHTVSSKIVLDNNQTLQSSTDEFCLKPDTATTDQSLTVEAVNSVKFTGFGVATGEFSGFKVGLTGCGYSGADFSVTTSDGIALFDGLHSGCISDVTVTAFCEVDTPLEGVASTFKQCTKPEPVSALTSVVAIATVNSVTLTATFEAIPDTNVDAVLSVVPKCDNVPEDVQSTQCTSGSNCAIGSLQKAGCRYTFDVTMSCTAEQGADSVHSDVVSGDACTVPEPVSAAVVSTAADSVTTTGVVLTVTASTTVGVNPNSVIAVTPTCGGIAETVQYPACDGDSEKECELTALTPGCEYTFAVTMVCGRDQPYITSSTTVDVTACTKPSTIDSLHYDQITITTTSFNISNAHVISSSGTFESFVIKSVQGGTGTPTILLGLVEGLEAGNCYTVNMALKCGDLEGEATDKVLCTKHELIVGANMPTTDTITFTWPLNDVSLTSTGTTLTSYRSKVDQSAEVDQLTATGTVVTIDSQTPGSVISVSTIFGYSQTQTETAGPSDFCLKPNPATQGTLLVATDSIGFTGLGVTSGEFTGHFGRVIGCNTVSKSSTNATLTFEGLTPACIYEVTIQSYCQPNDAEGTTGQIMGEDLTLRQCTKPLEADFSVSDITSTSCTVTITQPSDGNAEYYKFAFKLTPGDPNVFEAFQSTKTFGDLNPSSDNTIYATVQYDDPNAATVESDVREVICTTNPSNATIKWERISGSVIRVESVQAADGDLDCIDMKSDPALPDKNRYLNLDSNDFPLTIFSLQPGLKYSFLFELSLLGASEERECGQVPSDERSAKSQATLTVCSAPHPPTISVVSVTTSSFTIRLNNTNSLNESDEYQVKISRLDGSSFASTVTNGLTEYLVEGLDSDTRYMIEVISQYNVSGECGSTDVITSQSSAIVKTKFSGTPTNYTHEFVSPSLCVLIWAQPSTFVATEESSDSYYDILLNEESLLFRTLANKTNYSRVIKNLKLCSDYSVSIVPAKNEEFGDKLTIVLRDWSNLESATKTMRDFPQSMDECGFCPNAEVTDICQFPFEYKGQNYSTCTVKHTDDLVPGEDPWTLFCKKIADATLMECNTVAKKCLPEMPVFEEGWAVETVAVGSVNVSWNTSSDFYSAFNLYLNNESLPRNRSRDKSELLQNLQTGMSYIFEVELDSYGRLSARKSINFVLSNTTRNAFAYEATVMSVELAWDDLGTQSNNLSGILMVLNVEITWLLNALFTEEDKNYLRPKITLPLGTSSTVENLTSGLTYDISLTGIDDQNNTVENTLVVTKAQTVPNAITKQENNLIANFDFDFGISVTFNITKDTTAEYFIVEVFEVCSDATLEEVEGESMVTGYVLNTTAIDMSCQALNQSCIDSLSLGYQQNTFETGLKPGASYIVRISGLTAATRGETTVTEHTQPPNPVKNLMVDESLETSIQLSWQLPQGSIQGFQVTYTTHDGSLETESTDGRTAILSSLIPGFNYTFSVSAVAGQNVQSSPLTIDTGTRPGNPEAVTAKQLSDYGNSFNVSVQPPSTGFWSYLEITSVEDVSTTLTSSGETMLLNRTLPVRINNDTLSQVIHIAKSGTVVSIRVTATSDFGLVGRSSRAYIITRLQPIEKTPEVMINDKSTLCIIWDYPKQNVFYNCVKAKASTWQTITDKTQDQQDAGLMCFEKFQFDDDSNFTVELQFATIDLERQLETFSMPQTFTLKLHGNPRLIDVAVDASCEGISCTVEMKVDLFPNYNKFHFRYKIAEMDGSTFHFNDTFSLSKCTIESQLICSIQIMDLQENQNYEIEVALALFDKFAPVNANGTFKTGFSSSGSDRTVVIIVSVVIVVLVLIAVTAGIVFMVKKCSRTTEVESFDDLAEDPNFSAAYGIEPRVRNRRSHFDISAENYFGGYNSADRDIYDHYWKMIQPRNQMDYIEAEEYNQGFESSRGWTDPGYVNSWDNLSLSEMSPYLRPKKRSMIFDD